MPLAALLDRIGFFDACAQRICSGRDHVPVAALWWFAAATTIVLNLDTTVVLLTPLYLRLAQRIPRPATAIGAVAGAGSADESTLALAVIPLLLASLASSVLPVSNLTTIIASDHLGLSVLDVLTHSALPSLAACGVGWLFYRRLHPSRLPVGPEPTAELLPLRFGATVVALVLVGFTLGPAVGVAPWMVAAAADLVLMVRTRSAPLRQVPVFTALGVAALAALVSLLPADLLAGLLNRGDPFGLVAVAGAGVIGANTINNLPSALIAVRALEGPTWGFWAWLVAINTGAVLLPVGAVANVLWWRILQAEGVRIRLRVYLRLVLPIAAPATAVAVIVLVVERLVAGGLS